MCKGRRLVTAYFNTVHACAVNHKLYSAVVRVQFNNKHTYFYYIKLVLQFTSRSIVTESYNFCIILKIFIELAIK